MAISHNQNTFIVPKNGSLSLLFADKPKRISNLRRWQTKHGGDSKTTANGRWRCKSVGESCWQTKNKHEEI